MTKCQKTVPKEPHSRIRKFPPWFFKSTPTFSEPLPHTKALVALFLLILLEIKPFSALAQLINSSNVVT